MEHSTVQDPSSSAPQVPGPTLEFAPLHGEISSPAYSNVFKGIAVVLMALASMWAWQMQQGTGPLTADNTVFWIWAPWGLMAYTVWFVVTGTTTLTASAIEQRWMWSKRVELHNLAYAKVIRVPGFEWLFAPRLYSKTFGGKLVIFYAASPEMLDEMKRLENSLNALRQQR